MSKIRYFISILGISSEKTESTSEWTNSFYGKQLFLWSNVRMNEQTIVSFEKVKLTASRSLYSLDFFEYLMVWWYWTIIKSIRKDDISTKASESKCPIKYRYLIILSFSIHAQKALRSSFLFIFGWKVGDFWMVTSLWCHDNGLVYLQLHFSNMFLQSSVDIIEINFERKKIAKHNS